MSEQDAEKVALLTRPTPARRDAPFRMRRSRVVQGPQRGPGRLTNSPARTSLVLLIRRTVRPRGYASGPSLAAALLDSLFEHLARRTNILISLV